ncbi:murein L,D-transpeptidase [Pseudooctadecabacter sp.]|uniref:L,D-transpeptidase family protein n=1 Tax=Pseudooctadecabacter sp. TaxID=1966338 RepID=UPI0035C7CE20
MAEGAARDEVLAEFCRARSFEGIWTGTSRADRNRRNALLAAFANAGDHGLPTADYNPDALMSRLQSAQTPAEKGAMEVEMSRLFLSYARDIQTGILMPSRVVADIKREIPLRSRLGYLQSFTASSPQAFLASLPPSAPEYARLLREKLKMGRLIASGGWGAMVPGGMLEPGNSGARVVALRDRLIAMGFMDRSATQTYDATMQAAVQRFQTAHGLTADGIAGEGTLREMNIPASRRMQQVIVAMERERWTNRPRGERPVWVNLTDFTAAIMDNDSVTFSTRSVIGATDSDRQSPEFSNVMEFMGINPGWYVPRSIIVGEYLPALQRNRNAVSHIEITNRNGRVVNRGAVNFSQYNIYLHDTLAKSLFDREVRAFSHGCVRLNDPFDFAYALLAVHIVYRTAFTHATGPLNFRRDIYNRDSRIWNALAGEGVAVRAIGG